MPVYFLFYVGDISVVCRCIPDDLLSWANIFSNLCAKGRHKSTFFWEKIA